MTEKLPGILVDKYHDPVTPTIIYTVNYETFTRFCQSSRVKPQSRNVTFMGHNSSDGRMDGALHLFRHIAFVSFDPREYADRGMYRSSWYTVETLRYNGHFKRAFYYPNPLDVEPNYIEEQGRDWDIA